jgi:RimJ/RimL family protein N-acetyltransferase
MSVELRSWSEQDLELLKRLLGDPRMMTHLGGPETIWETGWSVLPEAQGRGLAKAGLRALLERLRTVQRQIHLHAFPGVENAASNGLCAALGFSLLGEVRFEYPKGHFMACNDWVFDLALK